MSYPVELTSPVPNEYAHLPCSDSLYCLIGTSRSASGNEAFIWDASNGMQGLGDPPGGIRVAFIGPAA